jgi:hypothetical protein
MDDLSRRAAVKLMLVASGALAVTTSRSHASDDNVNGLNVTSVQTRDISFTLGPMRRWVESDRSGTSFEFFERAREEHSVHLTDVSRSVRLQIDLSRSLILYADVNAPHMRPLYPITGRSAAVNGSNVIFVRVPNGRYLMTGPRLWTERGNDGVEFTFAELSRDDESVELFDPSRGVRLRIDLGGRRILYADAGAPQMRALYDIAEASAITA